MSKALDTVINDPDIKTVVLSARWHYFVNSKKGDFQLLDYKNDSNLITLGKLLSQTISELVMHKKKSNRGIRCSPDSIKSEELYKKSPIANDCRKLHLPRRSEKK